MLSVGGLNFDTSFRHLKILKYFDLYLPSVVKAENFVFMHLRARKGFIVRINARNILRLIMQWLFILTAELFMIDYAG